MVVIRHHRHFRRRSSGYVPTAIRNTLTPPDLFVTTLQARTIEDFIPTEESTTFPNSISAPANMMMSLRRPRKSEIFLFLLIFSVVHELQLLQLHKTGTQKSKSVRASNTVQILIPYQPDPAPTLKILEAMAPANITGTDADIFIQNNCSATSQVRLQFKSEEGTGSSTSSKWTIQTLDEKGFEKKVGGDEFYISFFPYSYMYNDSLGPERSAEHPAAVAQVKDLADGTYELDFISPPMMAVEDQSMHSAGGKLTIHFVYTCGIALVAPPKKKLWTNGGYTQTSYTVRLYDIAPPIRTFERPKRVVDLETFHHVVFVGDSVMEQFVRQNKVSFHSNLTFTKNMGKALNSQTWESFLKQAGADIVKAKDDVLKQHQHLRDSIQLAAVLGSSTWDILADDLGQGPGFNDHRNSMRKLIGKMKANYPDVTLIWKSPSAVHNHVVVNKKTKWFGPIQKAVKRVKYLSSSRSRDLYEYQKEICDELNVPFLDVYDAYYLSGDWHYPTDGRHYRGELNHLIFNWFYSKPLNITIDYSFTGY